MFIPINITEPTVASSGTYRIVAQASSLDEAYLAPWKVTECKNKKGGIDKVDTQNKAFELYETFGRFPSFESRPEKYQDNHVYYLYDDKGTLLRGPTDVYPDYVPLGT